MLYRNIYFWRNQAQAEIDYVEEYNGKLYAYEFKWGNKNPKMPKAFREGYPDSSFEVVNKDNFMGFVV
jgi:predicted AAA+ superfamily ATPase